MAVPKRKVSKSRRNQRRSHHALKRVNVVVDATTGEYKLPHHISLKDGYYDGRQVVSSPAQTAEDDSDSSGQAA